MSEQELFRFARMTPAEYQDDLQQMRLPLVAEEPRRKATTVIEHQAIRLAACPSCGGSTFDDGERPLVCHCGATIPGELNEKDEVLLLTGLRFPAEGALARYVLRKYAGGSG